MSQKRVILWTAPRCVSTAFERSMMNLKNSKIFHEPYYWPFFFGPERQSKRYSSEVIDPEATYRSVSEFLQKDYDGMELVFVKDFPFYIVKKFDIFLGRVHTWCPSTGARAPAQNGAVFRHWVPKISSCSHSINRARAHCI